MGRRIGFAAALTAALALALPGSASAFFSIAPSEVNFGKQKVGTSSETVTVTALGHCPDVMLPGGGFTVGPCVDLPVDIAVSGQFRIESASCIRNDLRLTCAIDVRFTPRNRGRQRGFLRIDSDPIEGVPLKGRGCVPKGKARRLRAKGKKVGKKNVCKSKKKG